jgi:hypothetical protein
MFRVHLYPVLYLPTFASTHVLNDLTLYNTYMSILPLCFPHLNFKHTYVHTTLFFLQDSPIWISLCSTLHHSASLNWAPPPQYLLIVAKAKNLFYFFQVCPLWFNHFNILAAKTTGILAISFHIPRHRVNPPPSNMFFSPCVVMLTSAGRGEMLLWRGLGPNWRGLGPNCTILYNAQYSTIIHTQYTILSNTEYFTILHNTQYYATQNTSQFYTTHNTPKYTILTNITQYYTINNTVQYYTKQKTNTILIAGPKIVKALTGR